MNKFKNFKEFEDYIESLTISKEKGDLLEKLAVKFFEFQSDFYQIENIYESCSNAPDRVLNDLDLQPEDIGVDLILEYKKGQPKKYACIQVKYRNRDKKSITRNDIANFLEASSRAFDGKKNTERIVFTNLETVMDRQEHLVLSRGIKKITREKLEHLPEHYFDFEKRVDIKEKPITPDPHQEKAVKKIIQGFRDGNDRGKYLSACGTGKTLSALWLIEEMKIKKGLFIVPSLALIQQTLEEWSKHSKEPFRYLCVCSDETVVNPEDDYGSASFIPHTTTNANEIKQFLNQSFDNPMILFATYQSLDRIQESVKDNSFEFDLIIFDEAHRTATGSLSENSNFNIGLSNDNIKSEYRLFMTATERILKARKIEGEEQEIFFSMDDSDLYGPTFDELPFREAINQGIIADYDICWLAIDDRQILDIVLDSNHEIKYLNDNMKEIVDDAFNLIKRELLVKAYEELKINKTFVFRSNIRLSENFIGGEELNHIDDNLYKTHIDGSMNATKRRRIFNKFNENHKSILSNARCLTEGVDVPNVDCIYFADPKSSLVSIVQACGRGLRKPRNLKEEKRTQILLPIIQFNLDQNSDNPHSEIVKEIRNNDFVEMFDIIQALRDSDKLLEEKINDLHRTLSTGGEAEIPFKIITNTNICRSSVSIDRIRKSISLNVARYNATDSNWEGFIPINIGTPGYIRAGDTIKLSPIADYSIVGFTKLIKRSLEILKRDFINNTPFTKTGLNHAYHQLKPNGEHNRFSHCERINIFQLVSDDNYELNDDGKNLLNSLDSSNFEIDVIKQIRSVVMERNELKYYPYQAILKIFEEVKSINYIHYLYGLNSMNGVSDNDIANVVAIIKELNHDYELLIQNPSNAELIWKELNKKYIKSYTMNDFMFQGTFKNKFNSYFKNHLLALFPDKILYDAAKKELKIKT